MYIFFMLWYIFAGLFLKALADEGFSPAHNIPAEEKSPFGHDQRLPLDIIQPSYAPNWKEYLRIREQGSIFLIHYQQPRDNAAIIDQARAKERYKAGFECQQNGDFKGAISNYLDACLLKPDDAAYQYALGTAYDNSGDVDNAIKMYTKAVAGNPSEKLWKDTLKSAKQRKASFFIQQARGMQSTKDGNGNFNYTGAIAAYEKALELDDDAATHLNLSAVYQAAGNNGKAAEHFKKSGRKLEDFPAAVPKINEHAGDAI